jgi:hypothetical protein
MLKSCQVVHVKMSPRAHGVPFIYENAAALDAREKGGPLPRSLKLKGRVCLDLQPLSELLSSDGKIFGERPTVEYRGRPDAK